jgi:exopolysaccharide biosynthesis polyprenyl glycosylphosphotransferase
MSRWSLAIALGDGVVVALVSYLAVFLRFGDLQVRSGGVPLWIAAFLIIPVWVAAMWLGGSYDTRFLPSGTEEYRRVVNASIWVLGFVGFTAFAFQANVSRTLIAIGFPSITIATLLSRRVARTLMRKRLRKGSTIHRTVVIGGREESINLLQHMRGAPHLGFSVVSVYLSVGQARSVEQPSQGTPLASITRPDELIAQIRSVGADTVAVAHAHSFGTGELRRLSWALEGTGIALLVAPPLTDIAGPRIVVRPAQGLPLLEIEEPEFRGANRVTKEVIDRALGALLLAVCSPLMVVIAVIIKLSDRGPIFFRQQRVGKLGATFVIWKFRTMTRDAEDRHQALLNSADHNGVLFKLANDPRVTRLGKFLRRYSLDELPQLFNVVSGSMSLVGPRPQRPLEVALYADRDRRRLLVKPGMTGLWQISGRSTLSWQEAIQLDLHYVDNWSVTWDLLILVKTAWAVFRSPGAY